jgi:hypothetical protein
VLYLLGHHDIGRMQTDQLLARIAEHPAHRWVRVEVIALLIRDQDPVGRVVEQCPVVSFKVG